MAVEGDGTTLASASEVAAVADAATTEATTSGVTATADFASADTPAPAAWDPSESWKDGTDTGISLQPAFVEGISSITDGTIRGIGLTSYQAERAAGVTFKDFDGNEVDDAGFMAMLKSAGVNYVTLKVAVDPADANGNTYGGGNPTLDNAIKTAKLAKDAGLKVNIQFLYSDFYTSADVQKAPKGWPTELSALKDKVKSYTSESLIRLANAGAMPDMVTIGSGIKNGFINNWANYDFVNGDDPKSWQYITDLISSATSAVRTAAPKANIAVSFADPSDLAASTTWADMLEYYKVDYDTFGVTVCPTTSDLGVIAQTRKMLTDEYDKSFAILDVQYPFTSNDSDGMDNKPNGYDIESAGIGEATPQGQADYVRKLYKSVVSADNNSDAAGVFYGDATQIAVHAGTNNADANKDAANTYGTGWASKYASSYVDGVGDYWGASNSDDKAFFDDLGKPLQSLRVFSDLLKENSADTDLVPDSEDPWKGGGDTGAAKQTASSAPIDTVTSGTIRGADISSYQALADAGVKVKDFDGQEKSLYEVLANNGVNYVRLRLFVNPYDADGNSFGGGNDDLPTVTKMAKMATDAGLKVMVDLHYNDFYASSWLRPVAWRNLNDEQLRTKVHDYTADVIKTLVGSGVDLGMVQVGNESNSGLLGKTVDWSSDAGWSEYVDLLQQASTAVRENAPDAKVAVHMMYTDSGTVDKICGYFQKYNLDYDVFGMTYYPFWSAGSDGTDAADGMAALRKSEEVATTKYGKEFAVMEFSQPFTSQDSDGYANNLADSGLSKYSVSVQGQADVIHDTFETVTTADGGTELGLGAFYWEPAWLPVKPGTNHWLANRLYANDMGTGWASKYCIYNNPDNTGEYNYWGGSGWDNQALFDDHGTPLQSLKAFSQILPGEVIKGISVDISTAKQVYMVGESLYTEGLVVNADYGDGDLRALPASSLKFSGFDSSKPGTSTVTVTYRGTSETYSTTFDVTVRDAAEVVSIKVNHLPNRTGYAQGSSLELAGLGVEATYADGTTAPVATEDCKITGFDSSKPGSCTVTVTYGGKSDTFKVDIWEAVKNGWVEENGVRHWYDWGSLARDKQFYDPSGDAWYWADADGSIARDKDVFVPASNDDRTRGKWVRYDADGRMVKGEDYRYGGWYFFDPVTGEMAKGVRWVPSSGGKWVYYDVVTGQMAHGEAHLSYDAEHTGWYYFDDVTGAMCHGTTFVRSNGGKWVYYDIHTGIMAHGYTFLDYDAEHTGWYYFDQLTGEMSHTRSWVPEVKGWRTFDSVTGKQR